MGGLVKVQLKRLVRVLLKSSWCVAGPNISPYKDLSEVFVSVVGPVRVARCTTLGDIMEIGTHCGLSYFGPGDSYGAGRNTDRDGVDNELFCDHVDAESIACSPLVFWCDYSYDWLQKLPRKDWIGLGCTAGYEIMGDSFSWWRTSIRRIFNAIASARRKEETKAGIKLAVEDLYQDALTELPIGKRTMLTVVLVNSLRTKLVIERDFPSA